MLTPTLSVVVPAFNEGGAIEACLLALLGQDDPIEEIIVVDNNSTDATGDVVSRLAREWPVIRLLTASEQGVINARSVGFDAARGDVLARVDADTQVGAGWSRAVRHFFRDHGDRFDAGSGLCWCYDLPFQSRFRRGHRALTASASRALESGDDAAAATPRLFGSNMAITRTVWERLSPHRSHRTDIFEDLELTLTLHAAGSSIALIPDADAGISGRRYLSSPRAYLRYCLRDQRTFRAHGLRRRAAMAVATTILLMYPFYLAMWLPFRAYDPATGRMVLHRFRVREPQRVLPSGTR